MTERQLCLLDFIRERIAEEGVAPSYEEMRRHLRLRSDGPVREMVDRLVRSGQLLRRRGVDRGLSLPTDVNLLGVSTARLEAELRRRRRRPMWSREFLRGLADTEARP